MGMYMISTRDGMRLHHPFLAHDIPIQYSREVSISFVADGTTSTAEIWRGARGQRRPTRKRPLLKWSNFLEMLPWSHWCAKSSWRSSPYVVPGNRPCRTLHIKTTVTPIFEIGEGNWSILKSERLSNYKPVSIRASWWAQQGIPGASKCSRWHLHNFVRLKHPRYQEFPAAKMPMGATLVASFAMEKTMLGASSLGPLVQKFRRKLESIHCFV